MPPIPEEGASPALPRIIAYYQTHHDPEGNFISILPLVTKPGISLTHVNLAAIHINEDPDGITLNDHAPTHARFETLWAELRILQATGIKVLGMLGGAAKGTYSRLEAAFSIYYPALRDLVRARALDGLDLDVEEPMSLAGIVRLIDALRADFGPGFILTMAPVAAALLDHRRNLSGFDYEELERLRGRDIAWYHAQFYCGWGDCSNPLMYEMILLRGWPARKVVVGMLTSPENGPGWVPWEGLASVLPLLAGRHPGFAGVSGWEYFNSLPGGKEAPWEWAAWMTALIRGDRVASAAAAGSSGGSGQHVLEDVKNEVRKEQETRLLTIEADPDEAGPAAPVPEAFVYESDGREGSEEEE